MPRGYDSGRGTICNHSDDTGRAQSDVFVSFFATNTLRTDNRIIAGDDLYSIIDCYVAGLVKVLRFVMPGVESRVIDEGFNGSRSLSPATEVAKFSTFRGFTKCN